MSGVTTATVLASASLAAGVGGTVYSAIQGGEAASARGAAEQKSWQARAQAAQWDKEQQQQMKEEAQLQATQQATQRGEVYRQLTGANITELTTRGVSSDSASFSAINDANREAAAGDIANIKYMGSARASKADMSMARNDYAMGRYLAAGDTAYATGQREMFGSYARGAWQLANNLPAMGKMYSEWTAGADTAPGGRNWDPR